MSANDEDFYNDDVLRERFQSASAGPLEAL